MLAFSNDYYGFIFRVTQSVELFCTYDICEKLKAQIKDICPILIKGSIEEGRKTKEA